MQRPRTTQMVAHRSPQVERSMLDRLLAQALTAYQRYVIPTALANRLGASKGWGVTVLGPIEVDEPKHVEQQSDIPAGCSK